MRGAVIATAAGMFVASALGGCRTEGTRASQKVAADPRYPPAVLTGDGELQCDISARSNGRQRLSIVNGGGLEFDAVVSPIIDGTVTARGPEKGGLYRFTSHLARPAKGRLPGRGDVEIEELETRVSVEMKRYQQPGGRGTALSFRSSEMATRGIYVEFMGRGRTPDGERFSFRINLGAPTDGSGRVVPADENEISNIASKVVTFRAPTNTVLVTTTVERGR